MVEVSFRYMERQGGVKLGSDGVRSARSSNPNWSKAFELLRYELHRIGAKDVVIEAGYKPHQVRADGWPYSNASPEHQQVRVSFKKGNVPISFFQGAFSGSIGCVPYNVWLIGMTLQALRAVDRYGCTRAGEQYRGWSQLPSSIQAAEWSNVEEAARWLIAQASPLMMRPEAIIGNPENLRIAYRHAANRVHPDKGGGHELMSKVNRAKDFIEKGSA